MTSLRLLTAAALGAFIFRRTGPVGMGLGAIAVTFIVSRNRAVAEAGAPPIEQHDPEPSVPDVQATGAQPSVPGRWVDSTKGRLFIADHR